MYQIVETIYNKFEKEGIIILKPLLDAVDFKINLWIATHLPEKVPLVKETEEKAFSIIEKVAAGGHVLVLGYQCWIKDWKLKRVK